MAEDFTPIGWVEVHGSGTPVLFPVIARGGLGIGCYGLNSRELTWLPLNGEGTLWTYLPRGSSGLNGWEG